MEIAANVLMVVSLILVAISLFLFVSVHKENKEVKGLLIVLEDPEDGPYLFLESDISIEEIKRHDKITFLVKIRTPQNKQSL